MDLNQNVREYRATNLLASSRLQRSMSNTTFLKNTLFDYVSRVVSL